MRKLLPVLAGLLTLLVYATAWAQDTATAEPNAVTRITELIFEILMVVLPLVATWLVHRGIKVFETKTKVDVPDAIEIKIDEWVERGIHLAAEKSYQKVKEKTAKLSGPEKLEVAADFVFDMAQSRGWIDWSKDKIKAKVEAAIGQRRAGDAVPKLEDK